MLPPFFTPNFLFFNKQTDRSSFDSLSRLLESVLRPTLCLIATMGHLSIWFLTLLTCYWKSPSGCFLFKPNQTITQLWMVPKNNIKAMLIVARAGWIKVNLPVSHWLSQKWTNLKQGWTSRNKLLAGASWFLILLLERCKRFERHHKAYPVTPVGNVTPRLPSHFSTLPPVVWQASIVPEDGVDNMILQHEVAMKPECCW